MRRARPNSQQDGTSAGHDGISSVYRQGKTTGHSPTLSSPRRGRSIVKPRFHLSRIIILALVGVLVSLAAIGGKIGENRANTALDKHWRGSYDILVTAPGGLQAISPGNDPQGLRLIDTNFAAQSLPRINDDVAASVATLDGVDIAAPVGFVGRMTNTAPYPVLTLSKQNLREKPIQTYTIHWKISENDGLGQRVLFERTNTFTIDARQWNGQSGYSDTTGIEVTTDIAPNDREKQLVQFLAVEHSSNRLLLGLAPMMATSVVAIDPAQEKRLMEVGMRPDAPQSEKQTETTQSEKREAGSSPQQTKNFLQALIDFDHLTQRYGPITAKNLWDWETESCQGQLCSQLASYPGAQPHNRPALRSQYGEDSPFVGYVANTAAYPDTLITAEVADMSDGSPHYLGSTSLEGGKIGPFVAGDTVVAWPGESKDGTESNVLNSDYITTDLSPVSLRPIASPTEGQAAFTAGTFRQILQPFRTVQRSALEESSRGTGQGQEIAYRDTNASTLKIGTDTLPGVAPFQVSSFTPSAAIDPLLGLYQRADMTTSRGSLLPSRHGTNIATQSPGAIVSLTSARLMTDSPVISAIRVRVKNVEGLTRDEALASIDELARRIRALDLEATVVAGASTEEAKIFVPAYAYGTSEAEGTQKVEELGWTSVTYSILGAASWTAGLTNTAVQSVTFLCLLLGAACLIGLYALARPQRHATHALLATQGWSVSRRLVWTMREEWPGLAVCCAGLFAGIAVAPGYSRWGSVVLLLSLFVGVVVANPVKARRLSVSSSLGTRLGRAALLFSETLTVVVSAVVFGLIVSMVEWFRRVVARTQLGSTVLASLVPLVAVVALTLSILAGVAFLIARHSSRIASHRIGFAYWNLGYSRAKILVGHALPVFLCAFIAAGSVCAWRRMLVGYEWSMRIFVVVSVSWVFFWAVFRLATLLSIASEQMRPRRAG